MKKLSAIIQDLIKYVKKSESSNNFHVFSRNVEFSKAQLDILKPLLYAIENARGNIEQIKSSVNTAHAKLKNTFIDCLFNDKHGNASWITFSPMNISTVARCAADIEKGKGTTCMQKVFQLKTLLADNQVEFDTLPSIRASLTDKQTTQSSEPLCYDDMHKLPIEELTYKDDKIIKRNLSVFYYPSTQKPTNSVKNITAPALTAISDKAATAPVLTSVADKSIAATTISTPENITPFSSTSTPQPILPQQPINTDTVVAHTQSSIANLGTFSKSKPVTTEFEVKNTTQDKSKRKLVIL